MNSATHRPTPRLSPRRFSLRPATATVLLALAQFTRTAFAAEPAGAASDLAGILDSLSTIQIVLAIFIPAVCALMFKRAADYLDMRRRATPAKSDDDTDDKPQEDALNAQPMQQLVQMMEVRKEMNPLTEAEVLLAFGRDGEAETLMLESIRKSPMKIGYRIKLAEIYAQRRDSVSFHSVSAKLRVMTEASGPVWAHICEMGLRLEPANPDYQYNALESAQAASFVAHQLDAVSHVFEDTEPQSLPMQLEPDRKAAVQRLRPSVH